MATRRHGHSTGSGEFASDEMVGIEDLHGSELNAGVDKGEIDAIIGEDVDGDGDGDVSPVGSNVRVIVRVRPFLPHELSSGTHTSNLIRIDDRPIDVHATSNSNEPRDEDGERHAASTTTMTNGQISIGIKESEHAFTFDAVLTPQQSQLDVYEAGNVERMLKALLKGYHATIFAYGQTVSPCNPQVEHLFRVARLARAPRLVSDPPPHPTPCLVIVSCVVCAVSGFR